jgi:hypothetical protein
MNLECFDVFTISFRPLTNKTSLLGLGCLCLELSLHLLEIAMVIYAIEIADQYKEISKTGREIIALR